MEVRGDGTAICPSDAGRMAMATRWAPLTIEVTMSPRTPSGAPSFRALLGL